jgi:hypothetical protein
MLVHVWGFESWQPPTEHYQASDIAQVGRGLYYIGEDSVRPGEIGQISSNCITCKQRVWSKVGSTDGSLRLSLRGRSTMKGYLVSCSIPKSKQKRQLLGVVSNHISSGSQIADIPSGGGGACPLPRTHTSGVGCLPCHLPPLFKFPLDKPMTKEVWGAGAAVIAIEILRISNHGMVCRLRPRSMHDSRQFNRIHKPVPG